MKKRLGHLQSTITGIALIGIGAWLIHIEENVWAGLLITAGLGALGYKPKDNQ
jgi:hypothetical protein